MHINPCSDGVIGILDVNGAVDLGSPARRTVTYVIGGVGVRLDGGGGDDPMSSVSMHGGLGLRVAPTDEVLCLSEPAIREVAVGK